MDSVGVNIHIAKFMIERPLHLQWPSPETVKAVFLYAWFVQTLLLVLFCISVLVLYV